MIRMFDAINVDSLPPGGGAYAGYVGGHWPTYTAVKARFPGVPVLSIAVTSTEDAECLDVEQGDATAADAPGWVRRQQGLGVALPVVYTSLSNVPAVMQALNAAGVWREQIRLWTAHYTEQQHICSPAACGVGVPVDGTQWHSGADYDESLLLDSFFTGPAPVTVAAVTPPVVIPPPPSLEDEVAVLVSVPAGAPGHDGRIWLTNGIHRRYVTGPTDLQDMVRRGMCAGSAPDMSVVNVQPIDAETLAVIPVAS